MFKRILIVTAILLIFIVLFMRTFYVWDSGFPDRTGKPLYTEDKLELVANLEYPPANIALSDGGRIFVTLHPEGSPPTNLGEIINGKFVPWKSSSQANKIDLPSDAYGLRVDNQGNLWVLDNYPARLIRFDIQTGQAVEEYIFDSDAFPFASHANDLQVSSDDDFIYITDDGLYNHKPALVVYDVKKRKAWRKLGGHISTKEGEFTPVVQGVEMTMLGLFSINPGVDGLALSHDNQWLYYASFSSNHLYRVATSALNQPKTPAADKVEQVSLKTFTDGMIADKAGNVYLSDIEHSAIMRVTPQFQLETLLESDKLRWPDGFAIANNGTLGESLFITCSSLHQVILKSVEQIKLNGPYQIYKLNLKQ